MGASSQSTRGVIPNFHYVHPINDQWAFGVSTLVPYGLGLEYSDTSLTRYDVFSAHQKGFELSPSLAYAINCHFSVGLGIDWLYYAAQLKSAQRTQPLTIMDSISTNEASSYNNFGWHAGILYQMNPQTRIGLNYRSSIVAHLGGTSRFYVRGSVDPAVLPNGMTTNNNLRIILPFACQTTLSIYRDMTPCWAMLASLQYEGWGIYKYDHAYRVATPQGPVNEVLRAGYHNTLYAAVGTNYVLTDKWLARGGVGYDLSFVSRTTDRL